LNGIGPFGFGRFESFGVAYIQMIKAIMPVLTLVLMFALKLEKSSPTYTKIIISISVGVIIASVGELHFHVVGFRMQAIAVCAEAMRLTLVNGLLSSKGLKLDAMSGASYFSPTCAVLISVCCAIFEWDTIPVGTFDKDILLIAISTIVFPESHVTPTQMLGYSIALFGLQCYKEFKANPVEFEALGVVGQGWLRRRQGRSRPRRRQGRARLRLTRLRRPLRPA